MAGTEAYGRHKLIDAGYVTTEHHGVRAVPRKAEELPIGAVAVSVEQGDRLTGVELAMHCDWYERGDPVLGGAREGGAILIGKAVPR
jgi:hypothetical protein